MGANKGSAARSGRVMLGARIRPSETTPGRSDHEDPCHLRRHGQSGGDRHHTGSGGDIWHLNEILQTRRNTKAARRLLMRPLRKQGAGPERMITDKLKSYGAAKRRGMPFVEHQTSQRPEQQGRELTSTVAKARSLSPPEKSLNRLSIPHPS